MVKIPTNIGLSILRLYSSDYLAGFHVREIAALTKKNHVTLIPHLKAWEERGILVPKISGKNKTYSLNFNTIITKEYLAMAEIAETVDYLDEVFIIKKIVKEIVDLRISGIVVLFGSYAKRSFSPESDIDILLLGNGGAKEGDAVKAIGKPYGKDIRVKTSSVRAFESMLDKKDPLAREILRSHITLQGRFVDLLWRYFDGKRTF